MTVTEYVDIPKILLDNGISRILIHRYLLIITHNNKDLRLTLESTSNISGITQELETIFNGKLYGEPLQALILCVAQTIEKKQEGENNLDYCIDVILREAKDEERVIMQSIYTMLSADTNNPINLLINAPSGVGKNYDIGRVLSVFPEEDVISLSGMTDKALFHRPGILVVKNEETGKYDPVEPKLDEIRSAIMNLEAQIELLKIPLSPDNGKNGDNDDGNSIEATKVDEPVKSRISALKQQIEEKKREISKLLSRAKKLIDLSHKILVFLDAPPHSLLTTMLPLLSHDKWEIEYEFVDTSNGIKTKSNVLRGWPVVIIAQAPDFSKHPRSAEVQRRFVITNPTMTRSKYDNAIELICDKLGMPNIAYQAKTVTDGEKNAARSVIMGLKATIREICKSNKPGEYNVTIPFHESIGYSLPRSRANDMENTNRLFKYIQLSAIIHSRRRPRLEMTSPGSQGEAPSTQISPMATFEDLKVAVFLMGYGTATKPFVLEWYNEVFLTLFNSKTEPNKKTVTDENGGIKMTKQETIKALTTRELIEETRGKRSEVYSNQQMHETFIDPLLNTGYIDKADSEIDGRSKIYFPVVEEDMNLFEMDASNNNSHERKLVLKENAYYPTKSYIISKIEAVMEYCSTMGVKALLKDEEGDEKSIEEIFDTYYQNAENHFKAPAHNGNDVTRSPTGNSASAITQTTQVTNSVTSERDTRNEGQPMLTPPSNSSAPSDRIPEQSLEGTKNDNKSSQIIDNSLNLQKKDGQYSLKLVEEPKTNKIIHLTCPYCDFKKELGAEFDLGNHLFERHRYQLRALPLESTEIEPRIQYVIEMIGQRALETAGKQDSSE